MERIAEPELMTDADQVAAYAAADFEAPHGRYLELLRERLPRLAPAGAALDIGCGPGDITCRFASAFPGWSIDGLDGSEPMLAHARSAAQRLSLDGRVSFHHCRLPEGDAPRQSYDLICSNSLLHHLNEPLDLWLAVRKWSRAGTAVFVMDLLRPDSVLRAQQLVEAHSSGEPEVLRRDFFNSLLAAYRPGEVRAQLERAGLGDLRVEVVSDRHWLVTG